MSYEEFASKAREMDESLIENLLLDQIYRVSKIASVKMRRVRCAFILSGPVFILWIMLLVWGTMS